jgi:hypothetical protein
LEQTLQDLKEDQFETPALLALILALFAGLEWLRSYTGKGPQPLAFALAAGSPQDSPSGATIACARGCGCCARQSTGSGPSASFSSGCARSNITFSTI